MWTDSTLRGHAKRGTGIINNELYIGKLVWNRLRYLKDPATGKRVSRINPPEKWITRDVPELRIVDDELWERAKEKQAAIREARKPLQEAKQLLGFVPLPRHLPYSLDIWAGKKLLSIEWDDEGQVDLRRFARGDWRAKLLVLST